jgi:excisionase family DNA binding protein
MPWPRTSQASRGRLVRTATFPLPQAAVKVPVGTRNPHARAKHGALQHAAIVASGGTPTGRLRCVAVTAIADLSDTDDEDMLSPEEVAAMFSVSARTIRRLAAAGKLGAVRIGGQWRMPREGLPRPIDVPPRHTSTRTRRHR